MPRLIDISPRLTPALAVFPGDTPLSREVLLRTDAGDPVTLSTLRSTVHLGAHVDAPSHYGCDVETVDEIPLERFIGPCEVVRVGVAPGGLVGVAHLPAPPRAPRVLLATGTHPDPDRWAPEFAGLDPALVDHLADLGVCLVGVDVPSVDPATSKSLPAHARFLVRDLSILEGIVLDGVAPGLYELIALPLRLVGFDASPVRAVLRTIE
ncbi:MAG TPA: cyclase family protein [Phycisphaerales bacterium]|nr:cyclase family protein [Phycisphaerales bacterium]HMP37229.1 cyclase family protein [Phycisphaerales bacterium]